MFFFFCAYCSLYLFVCLFDWCFVYRSIDLENDRKELKKLKKKDIEDDDFKVTSDNDDDDDDYVHKNSQNPTKSKRRSSRIAEQHKHVIVDDVTIP